MKTRVSFKYFVSYSSELFFVEKDFSYYVPLTDQVSLSGCLYLRYWEISAL